MFVIEHRGHIAVHHDVVFGVHIQRLAILQQDLDVGHLAIVVYLIRIGTARAIDGAVIGGETAFDQIDNF